MPRTRDIFTKIFIALSCWGLPSAVLAKPPNVLLIMVDDLRPMLGCYGDNRIKTPNLDRLASQGVVFERAYCQYAKCCTSRLSMMTGLRPDSIGVFSNNEKDVEQFRDSHPQIPSMAKWFRQGGYHTQSFGKIYHDGCDNADDWSAPSQPGRQREMWEIVPAEDETAPTIIAERLDCPVMQSPDVADDHLFAGRMTRQVIETFKQLDPGKPTFLAVGYRRPHLPFVAPRKYFDLYTPDASWLATPSMPSSGSPIMAWFNSDGYVGSAKRIGLTMPIRPNREQAIAWNGYEMRSYNGVPKHGVIEQPLQLQLLHAYAACVSYVDAQVGLILDHIDSSLENDTIIIVCSDHGWHLGEHSTWGKMTNFEVATRVPLILVGPGIRPGRVQSLAELVDLYPTLCDLAGLDKPDHLEGESLAPVIRGQRSPDEGFALSQYLRFGDRFVGRAIRNAQYRFVRWTDTRTDETVHRELYDHRSDSSEVTNLSDHPTHARTLQRLEALLDAATSTYDGR